MSDTIDQEELTEKCDYDPCHCVPAEYEAVVDGKTVYCSEGCRRGSGCTHEPCNCRELTGKDD